MATGMWYGRPEYVYPRRQPYRSNTQVAGDYDLGLYAWTLDNAVGVQTLTWEVCLTQQEPITIRNCPELVHFSAGSVQQSTYWVVTNNSVMTTASFPSVFNFTELTCSNNPSLGLVNFYDFSPPIIGGFSNFGNLNLSNNALTSASVNSILATLVIVNIQNWGDLTGSWSGSIDLTGGTNAPPSGQGLTDKATLQSRGAVVLTN